MYIEYYYPIINHKLAGSVKVYLNEYVFKLLLTPGPVLVDVGFVLELLGEVLESLQPHHFAQQPFLEGLLGDLKTFPCV